MCQLKASLINIRLTSKYSAGSYAFAVKDFVHYFRRLRSSQVHNFMAALTCLRSVETNLTLTSPPPNRLFVISKILGDTWPAFSRVSLSLSLRRAGRREPWERGWLFRKGSKLAGCSIRISLQWPCANVFHKSFNSFTCWAPFMLEEVRNLKIIRKISILISRLWSLN